MSAEFKKDPTHIGYAWAEHPNLPSFIVTPLEPGGKSLNGVRYPFEVADFTAKVRSNGGEVVFPDTDEVRERLSAISRERINCVRGLTGEEARRVTSLLSKQEDSS